MPLPPLPPLLISQRFPGSNLFQNIQFDGSVLSIFSGQKEQNLYYKSSSDPVPLIGFNKISMSATIPIKLAEDIVATSNVLIF